MIAIRVVFRSVFATGVTPARPHPVHAAAPADAALVRRRAARRPGLARGHAVGRRSTGCGWARLLCCIGAANTLANPKRALRVLPGALYELGVAVTVAISVAPQLVESVQRVRRARRLRAGSGKGFRALRSIAIPVLEDALERSLQLAAAMDSRGYGRHRHAPPAARRRLTAALMLAGMLGLCAGVYGLLDAHRARRLLGLPALLGGALLCCAGLALGGRRVSRTSYRPDPWRLPGVAGRRLRAVPRRSLLFARDRATTRRAQPVALPAELAGAAAAAGRRRSWSRRWPAFAAPPPPPRRPATGPPGRRAAPRPETAVPAMIELRPGQHHATPTPTGAGAARRQPARSPRASCAWSSGRTGAGKSTLLGAINGLVPHFTGGTLAGRVTRRRPRHRRPPAARAGRRRRRGRAGPAGRLRHRHRRGGAGLRHGAARRAGRRSCASGSRRRSTCSAWPTCGTGRCTSCPAASSSGSRSASVLTAHPAGPGARRADLGARPDRGRGGAGRDHPAGARPRGHRACWPSTGSSGWCSTPTGCSTCPATARSSTARRPRCSQHTSGRAAGGRAGPAGRLAAAAAVGARRPPRGRRRCATRLAGRPRRRPRTAARRPRPLLTRRKIVVRYGDVVAVREVDLTCRPGEVTALMGRNGSGKSSLLWALQGSGPRQGGTVDVGGQDPKKLAAAAGPRAGRPGAADAGRPALPGHGGGRARPGRPRVRPAEPDGAREHPRPARARASPTTSTRATCPRASGCRWCWPSS